MRVAVLGAGYAGLTVARQLARTLPDEVELVVVDETGDHLLKHELHRAVRRPSLADDLRIPLPALLDRATIRTDRVVDVDPAAGIASLADGDLPYDYGAVCLGAETAFYGLPGLEEHATPLERLADARAIRERFLQVCEEGGRAVVGGAGLSGIQVAGELAELADGRGATGRVEVVLAEQLATVAPGFPDDFQRAIREELIARDVTIRTGTTVTGATADRVETEDGGIAYDQLVWTGGIRGPTALSGDRRGVRATLRSDDGTFVLGDAARIVDDEGRAVPATAQAAIREARVAARNVRRLVESDRSGGDPGSFDPRLDRLDFEPLGWTVSVGDGAVAKVGPTVLRGAAARAVKATAGLGHLTTIGRVREAMAVVGEELD